MRGSVFYCDKTLYNKKEILSINSPIKSSVQFITPKKIQIMQNFIKEKNKKLVIGSKAATNLNIKCQVELVVK